ncbi:MAG: spermidine/putrescine ABC transporter substrate-binding protein [Opitutaceae bacterium]
MKVRQLFPSELMTEQIHILIWDHYLPSDVIEDFENETGIAVIVDHDISSNDDLRAKLLAKPGYYDLAMPSAFMAKLLLGEKKGILQPFNRAMLTNLKHIDRQYNPKFDSHNDWVVPYIYGATGIAYNKHTTEVFPRSWADLFPPSAAAAAGPEAEHVPDLEEIRSLVEPGKRIALMDDGRFVLASVLLAQDKDIELNSATEKQIRAAGEYLKSISNQIVFIDSTNESKILSLGLADMALAWTSDATVAMVGNKELRVPRNLDIRFALPEEGTIISRKCFVLVKGPNSVGAEKFLNYLLRPNVAGRVTSYSYCATTVKDASYYVEGGILNSPSFFLHPTPEKNFFLEDTDSKTDALYAEVWDEVRNALHPRVYTGTK